MGKIAFLALIVFAIQIHGYIEVERLPNNLVEWGTLLLLCGICIFGTLSAFHDPDEVTEDEA